MGRVVVGWICSSDARMVPFVRDESGKVTVGFSDSYRDPFTAVAQETTREAMEVATSPEAKEGLLAGSLKGVEIISKPYLGPVGYYAAKAIVYMIEYILMPDEAW